MTRSADRLAALAASFAPARTASLLGLLRAGESTAVAARAAALAGAPREERLRALEAALAQTPPAVVRARARQVAAGERPRLAAAALAVARAAGGMERIAPLLRRILAERLSW